MFYSLFALATLILSVALPVTAVGIPPSASRLAPRDGECTPDKLQVRKDWTCLTTDEREAYTAAVHCIYNTPSNLDPTAYPAAINRYLDYAVIHVQRSLNIHFDGFFLTWHRYYMQLWYNDLRDTCGYTGPMPYWNFPETAGDLPTSAVFDGSATSMSGDGVYNNTGPIALSPTLVVPAGTGGGCVYSGPFANWIVTLTPIDLSVALTGGPLPATAYDYNPTCLQRDLNSYIAQTWTNAGNVSDALNAPDIESFSAIIDGSIVANLPGVHAAAHFQVGGQMSNIFVSPQDPIWYLAHVYIDYLYTTWQNMHPDAALGIFGTETFGNVPPSPNVTLDTYQVDWGYFAPSVQVKDLISTTAGPFCYTYE